MVGRIKSDAVRENLLRAATELFSKEGFSGARVDEIAERAGANKAMIYYYFGSKAGLYKAVLGQLFELVHDQIPNGTADQVDPLCRLKGLYAGLLAAFEKQPDLPRVMLREILAGGQHMDPATGEMLRGFIYRVASTLAEGRAQGVFRDVHPLLIHLNAVGMLLVFSVGEAFRSRMAEILEPSLDFPRSSDVLDYLHDVLTRTLAPPGLPVNEGGWLDETA